MLALEMHSFLEGGFVAGMSPTETRLHLPEWCNNYSGRGRGFQEAMKTQPFH